MSVDASHVGTVAEKGTGVAGGSLCMADLPPVPDEVDVQGVDPFRRRHFGEKGMSHISTHFWAN